MVLSVEKSSSLPDSVPHLPQISPLQSPPRTFEHRARAPHRAVRPPSHDLVRRQHLFVDLIIIILEEGILPATSHDLRRQDRDVNWRGLPEFTARRRLREVFLAMGRPRRGDLLRCGGGR